MYQYTMLESQIKNFLHSKSIFVPKQLTMARLTKRTNINLRFYDDDSAATVSNGAVYIFINERLPENLQWIEFCHEFCHATQHYGDQMRLQKSFVEYQESKARNFAMHLSVPTLMLRRMHLPHNIIESSYMVADMFNVTPNYALRRLRHLENQTLSAQLYESFKESVPSPLQYLRYGTSEEV
ncbi:ImmA/IrrE family metallo-endopeptidase [Halobacillus sp. SY10]|uniref:ImmA/IrrE family metallo-endopeptidase n=1 Tax=Halobacillus sp. SY10 TaxID=3381356 RepID=UPI00387A44B9